MFASTITPLHIERGRQMRQLVRDDITRKGLSFEAAVESLASYLGIDVESVKLGIAIANGADADNPLRAHNAKVQAFYAAARS